MVTTKGNERDLHDRLTNNHVEGSRWNPRDHLGLDRKGRERDLHDHLNSNRTDRAEGSPPSTGTANWANSPPLSTGRTDRVDGLPPSPGRARKGARMETSQHGDSSTHEVYDTENSGSVRRTLPLADPRRLPMARDVQSTDMAHVPMPPERLSRQEPNTAKRGILRDHVPRKDLVHPNHPDDHM
ncbi:hypothetical protein RIF29_28682 [Crotalaria pallida]|uniref:Uncharacterized protein n=1 Tax=Crotalaria pallida TaxID=3830 RepID=A0AAN9EF99_CROPI